MGNNNEPQLGDRAREVVTEFEGIVTGESTFLNGCRRVMLSPPVDRDKKFVEAQWFDIETVEIIEAGVGPSFEAPAHRGVKGGYPDPPNR